MIFFPRRYRLCLVGWLLCLSFGSAFETSEGRTRFTTVIRNCQHRRADPRSPGATLSKSNGGKRRSNYWMFKTNLPREELRAPGNGWGVMNRTTVRRTLSCFVPFVLTTLICCPTHAETVIGVTHPAKLGVRNLLSAAVLLASLACLPLSWGDMGPLAKSLAISASRCTVQVSLLGSVLLQKMMGVTKPAYVLAWVCAVGLLAGRESIARIEYTYPNMERNMYLSVLTGGLTVLGLTLGLHILGETQPWFDPRTWISIAGMLFGNTLNASSLGAATITKQFA